MSEIKKYQFWFCTGSQDLYGEECLAHVAGHSRIIVDALNASGNLPYEVVWKPTLITAEVIRKTLNEANAKNDIFTRIAFITETLLIPIYLVSFAFNAKKIEYLKEFIFCAVKEEAEEKKQLTEIADANESGYNLNITIY